AVEEPGQRRAVAGEPPPGLAPRERYDVLAVWHRRDDAAVPVREHGPPTVDEELPARVPGDLDLHERAVGPHGAREGQRVRSAGEHAALGVAGQRDQLGVFGRAGARLERRWRVLVVVVAG